MSHGFYRPTEMKPLISRDEKGIVNVDWLNRSRFEGVSNKECCYSKSSMLVSILEYRNVSIGKVRWDRGNGFKCRANSYRLYWWVHSE